MATTKSAKATASAKSKMKPSAKKPVAKAKPVSKAKPAAKKVVRRTATRAARPGILDDLKPCKKVYSETDVLKMGAEKSGIELKEAKAFMNFLNRFAAANLMKGGTGKFKQPGGLFQMTGKFVPAKKGGKKVNNPFKPGETMITRDKPAKMQIKGRPLTKLRNAISI